ncbi:MAG: hypothetical protein IKH30_04600 [Clostridia bacterium]|nr:hypothetical protein [Clostridia bacterium]
MGLTDGVGSGEGVGIGVSVSLIAGVASTVFTWTDCLQPVSGKAHSNRRRKGRR